jgi:hypothetical protein
MTNFDHLDFNEGIFGMTKNTDWETWDSEFGPRNMDEAIALKAVAGGVSRSGPFTGTRSPNKKGWLISREGQRALRLNEAAAQKGFVQFMWYYTSGQRAWQKAPRTLEAMF